MMHATSQDVFGHNLHPQDMIATDVPINWDRALKQAIVDKNVEAVQQALASGADPKKAVHGEKMSVFVMHHFDENVANLMSRKTAFGDKEAIIETILAADNPQAMRWFLDRNPELQMDFNEALNASAVKCIKAALEHWALKPDSDKKIQDMSSMLEQLDDEFGRLLRLALQTNEQDLLHHMETLWPSQEMVRQLTCFFEELDNLSEMTLNDLLALEQWLTSSPSVFERWTKALSSVKSQATIFSNQSACLFKIDGTKKIKSSASWNRNNLVVEHRPYFWDFLMASGALAVQEALASPKGDELGARLLEHPGIIVLGLSSMAKAKAHSCMKMFLQHHPDWRDSKGNNLLHLYQASIDEGNLTTTFYKDMLSLSPALFSEPNHAGLPPSVGAPAALLAKNQRTEMRKVLREHGLTRNRPQSTKRKM